MAITPKDPRDRLTGTQVPLTANKPKMLGHITRFPTTVGTQVRVLQPVDEVHVVRFPSDALALMHSHMGGEALGEWAAKQQGKSLGSNKAMSIAAGPLTPPTNAAPATVTRLKAHIDREFARLAPTAVSGSLRELDGDGTPGGHEVVEVAEFVDRKSGTRYLLSNVESRAPSSAKRRRYVLDDKGKFYCGLEFLPPEKIYPAGTRGLAKKKLMFEANIRDELAKDVVFNPQTYVHALLKTEDGAYVALVDNLPEESSYLLGHLPAEHFNAAVLKLTEEVAKRISVDFHGRGYVHGDIKLENIMLTSQRRFVAIDFESVAPVDHTGLADIERVMWKAPETQAPKSSGKNARVGLPADVYAFGVSLLMAYAARARPLPDAKLSPARQQAMQEASDAHLLGALGSVGDADFQQLRQRLLAGTVDKKTDRLYKAYSFILEPCQQQAPELFEFVLKEMLSAKPQERASMAKVAAAAQMLRLKKSAEAVALDPALEQMNNSCMSAFMQPAMSEYAASVWTETSAASDLNKTTV